MPELPEVETTVRGLAPLVHHTFTGVNVRNPQLRQPVPPGFAELVRGTRLIGIGRRAKYILMQLSSGWLVWHLGMSGSMRLDAPGQPLRKHDHVLLASSCGLELRYHDPRRFGGLIHSKEHPHALPQLARLGIEPLEDGFTAEALFAASRNRRMAIKQLIMQHQVVVGIGNIYAAESLFIAGIDPRLAACKLTGKQAQRLVAAIKSCLAAAIAAGGTTLRDFINSRSEPGYFQQSLAVYGREGLPCVRCKTILRATTLGQRNTVWCPGCQNNARRRTGNS